MEKVTLEIAANYLAHKVKVISGEMTARTLVINPEENLNTISLNSLISGFGTSLRNYRGNDRG